MAKLSIFNGTPDQYNFHFVHPVNGTMTFKTIPPFSILGVDGEVFEGEQEECMRIYSLYPALQNEHAPIRFLWDGQNKLGADDFLAANEANENAQAKAGNDALQNATADIARDLPPNSEMEVLDTDTLGKNAANPDKAIVAKARKGAE